jgi:hypothetical protein
MDRHDIDAEQLNADALNAFLAEHVDRHGQLPSAGVMPLLGYLRAAGVAGQETARERSPLDGFLGEYRDGLVVERALASDTVRGYTRLARRFLTERVSVEDELGVDGLTGGDVTGFLLRESARLRAGSPGLPAASPLARLQARGTRPSAAVLCRSPRRHRHRGRHDRAGARVGA